LLFCNKKNNNYVIASDTQQIRLLYHYLVLAYLATKQQFLSDAPTIEDKVEAAVLSKLGIRVSPNEKIAWRKDGIGLVGGF